jgi:hypothetical protein
MRLKRVSGWIKAGLGDGGGLQEHAAGEWKPQLNLSCAWRLVGAPSGLGAGNSASTKQTINS